MNDNYTENTENSSRHTVKVTFDNNIKAGFKCSFTLGDKTVEYQCKEGTFTDSTDCFLDAFDCILKNFGYNCTLKIEDKEEG